MLARRQIIVLAFYAALLWAAAAAWIRWMATAIADPLRGDLGYLTSIPVCWICILVARRLVALSASQLVPGTALVVAAATLIDASVLRWAPTLYGSDEHVLHLGAAWLLWGYGITLAIALLMSRDRGTGPQADRSVLDHDPEERTA